jgi:replicative DNA helicase
MTNKGTIQQILGSLMKRPQFLSEVDKYSLSISDFSTKFEKYVFNAIDGLWHNGAQKITALDIESYLEANDAAKKLFEQQNGLEYLQDIEEFSNIENFPYYYTKLKKLNLLRDLKKQNFPVSEFYQEDLTAADAMEINQRFEKLTVSDIITAVKKRLLVLESNYAGTEEVQEWNIGDDIDDIVESFGVEGSVGLPIQGSIFNKIIDGAQRSCLTIRSGASGTGKTRNAVADACLLAFPLRFNSTTASWEQKGSNQKVLFIITEQTDIQIKKMILAYLTDINESKFKYGRFTDEERKRISQGKQIMKEFASNFILVRIPNPTIDLVKTKVREKVLLHDIGYVFYDYIFIGPALLNEFRGFGVRNDEVLLMMATALKDLAVELDVCVFTSTQVNANVDNNTNIRNESSLAGGRSTINKADNGAIMARPTKEELEILEPIITTYGRPNLVTDIFKVRSGEWTQVRIWSIVDLGTMRRDDLFLTDSRLVVINDFYTGDEYNISDFENEELIEIKRKVDWLNGLC